MFQNTCHSFLKFGVSILTTRIWELLSINNRDLKNVSEWVGTFRKTFMFM